MSVKWIGTFPDARVALSDRYRLTIERRILPWTFTVYRLNLCCELWDEWLRKKLLIPIDGRPVCGEPLCIIDVKPAVTLNGASMASVAENAIAAAGMWGNLVSVELLSVRQAQETQADKTAQRDALEAAGVGDRGGIGNTLVDLTAGAARGLGGVLGGITKGVLGALWPFLLVGAAGLALYVVAQRGGFRRITGGGGGGGS